MTGSFMGLNWIDFLKLSLSISNRQLGSETILVFRERWGTCILLILLLAVSVVVVVVVEAAAVGVGFLIVVVVLL